MPEAEGAGTNQSFCCIHNGKYCRTLVTKQTQIELKTRNSLQLVEIFRSRFSNQATALFLLTDNTIQEAGEMKHSFR